ncbi:hypothetical protein HYH02_006770 [Chlamydomonas schloesseri]|uniref:Uncharacterized protein n=1 Tax=Chlamydomonas schloesseri TaxID=2026947 RepID=A0A835WJV6_9CHLO|nr:hypothetical protein HYH02_006770 [Chlamydomonas schloesseri]|eukprot:KAG2448185.1 hypothetical protein HYH02_006770 [Chlamydomonas schloesseri]
MPGACLLRSSRAGRQLLPHATPPPSAPCTRRSARRAPGDFSTAAPSALRGASASPCSHDGTGCPAPAAAPAATSAATGPPAQRRALLLTLAISAATAAAAGIAPARAAALTPEGPALSTPRSGPSPSTDPSAAAAAAANPAELNQGMSLAAAREATSPALRSLERSYQALVREQSCAAVEGPGPDCLPGGGEGRGEGGGGAGAGRGSLELAQALVAASKTLQVSLPVVGADIAYAGSPAKRRRGVMGLLDAAERAARAGGGLAVDTADLEWLEAVEDATTAAVMQLRLLQRAAEGVVAARAGAGAGAERAEAGAGAGAGGGGVGAAAALVAAAPRLTELAYVCLRKSRAVLELDAR